MCVLICGNLHNGRCTLNLLSAVNYVNKYVYRNTQGVFSLSPQLCARAMGRKEISGLFMVLHIFLTSHIIYSIESDL